MSMKNFNDTIGELKARPSGLKRSAMQDVYGKLNPQLPWAQLNSTRRLFGLIQHTRMMMISSKGT
jgi:hypothetical protein